MSERMRAESICKENGEQRAIQEQTRTVKTLSLSISPTGCLQRISARKSESLILSAPLQLSNEISGQSELF